MSPQVLGRAQIAPQFGLVNPTQLSHETVQLVPIHGADPPTLGEDRIQP